MNDKTTRLKARFAPPTRFAVRPETAAKPFARPILELETLKARLLAERWKTARAFVPGAALRQAADEAASLAWLTAYPLLVLPVLFEELADVAARRARKQADIRQRSLMLQAA